MLSEENLLVKIGLPGSLKGVDGSDLVIAALEAGREEEEALKKGFTRSSSASSAS